MAAVACLDTGFFDMTIFQQKIEEIQKNTKNLKAFENRFYRWFNAFQLMKYVHFARDHYYPNIEIEKAINWLCEIYHREAMTAKEMLLFLRKEDKK